MSTGGDTKSPAQNTPLESLARSTARKLVVQAASSLFFFLFGLYARDPILNHSGKIIRRILHAPEPVTCSKDPAHTDDPKYTYYNWTITVPLKYRKSKSIFIVRKTDDLVIIRNSLQIKTRGRLNNEILDSAQKRSLGALFTFTEGNESETVITFTTQSTQMLEDECTNFGTYFDSV